MSPKQPHEPRGWLGLAALLLTLGLVLLACWLLRSRAGTLLPEPALRPARTAAAIPPAPSPSPSLPVPSTPPAEPLDPERTITGVVVDIDRNRLAGAGVNVLLERPLHGETLPELESEYGRMVGDPLLTDAEGRFVAVVPHAGQQYALSAYFAGVGFPLPTLAWAGERDLMLVVPPAATVRGFVYDEHGEPYAIAHVQIDYPDGSASMVVTKEDGSFTRVTRACEGCTAQALISPNWQGPPSDPFTIPAGGVAEIELLLPRGRDLAGVCLDEDGEPVGGLTVDAAPEGHPGGARPSAVTDDDGAFAIAGVDPDKRYRLRVTGSHQLSEKDRNAWHLIGERPVELRIRSLLEIRGRVLGHELAPGDVSIRCARVQQGPALLHEVPCDAEGWFRIAKLEPGDYQLDVRARGHIPIEPLALHLDRSITAVQVELERGGEITGLAVDAGGMPVPGARVAADWIAEEGEVRRRGLGAVTTENGRFVLDGADPAGVYRITARPPGAYPADEPSVRARAGDDVLVEVTAVPQLTGILRTSDDRPLGSVFIRSESLDPETRPVVHHLAAGAGGSFAIPLPEPAVASVVVNADGLAPQRVFLPETHDFRIDLGTIVLDEGVVLVGTVVDGEGRAIPGALVEVPATRAGLETDAGGVFTIPHMSSAIDLLRVNATGFSAKTVPLGSGEPLTNLRIVLARGE